MINNDKKYSLFTWFLAAREKVSKIYNNDKDVATRKLILLINHFLGEKNYFNFHRTYVEQKSIEKLDAALKEVVEDYKPLEYIIGSSYFLNCHINIEKPLLIPRVETEYWCEIIIERLKKFEKKNLKILDMCCGTGCIGIGFINEFEDFECLSVDISDQAISATLKNAEENGVLNRIKVLKSDLFENIKITDEKFDLILSNPPYIPEGREIDESVFFWEDANALFSKENGLFHIKKIILNSLNYLKYEGLAIIECDSENIYEAFDFVSKLNKYQMIKLLYDQYNMPRVILISPSKESFLKIEEKNL